MMAKKDDTQTEEETKTGTRSWDPEEFK